MMLSLDWSGVGAARLPLASASALAPLRTCSEVRWRRSDPWLWLRFPAGDAAILRHLQPIFGIEFYVQHQSLWFRFGHLVPTSEVPPREDGEALITLIQPEPLLPRFSQSELPEPVPLRLQRTTEVHPTTALRCPLRDLAAWINSATTWELSRLRGAWHDDLALILGSGLPFVTTGCHYWGTRVLRPLGYDVEGGYPEATLLKAAGTSADELLIVDANEVECVPEEAFQPLTRAGLRRALAGSS